MMAEAGGRKTAVVLLSGGLDSCVTAAIARQDHDLALLHVSYGQRTAGREREAFDDIARHYDVTQTLTTRLDVLGAIGGSALTDPRMDVVDARRSGSPVPGTYVPFRNTHLLAVAVSWAEVLGASAVFIGAVEEDSSGYPDCREEYYEAFNHLVRLGTRPETDLRVVTPLIRMSKGAIVRRGLELQAPLHLSWSCYIESEVACGLCESCQLRLKGFREAGTHDPLAYRHS